ncbi:hypothetical protein LTR56_021782 [Elasticomyces elasticus]|nr:hypothetical protein LTR56_021782 [Elasticomyces elasticus]KAK3630538.1 hypothetical protein LTR22_021454 [Elasticomyces elasticus]KAK4909077.1 hypothetical protein LTR49_022117 [Elasticomyces elasticus]KAK5748458.1 hypothetical protein LTS12_021477 [Elasticomyces elasticus]
MGPKKNTQKAIPTKPAATPKPPKPIDPSQKTKLDSFFKLPNSGAASARPRFLPDGYTAADAARFKEFTGQELPLSLSGSGLSVEDAIAQSFGDGNYTTGLLDEDKENSPVRKRKKTVIPDDDDDDDESLLPGKKSKKPVLSKDEDDDGDDELQPLPVKESRKKKGKQRVIQEDDVEGQEEEDFIDDAEGGFGGEEDEDDAANTAAMEEERAEWYCKMEETLDAGLLDEEVVEMQEKQATADLQRESTPPEAANDATPPLPLDELLAFCPTKKAAAFLRHLHARRLAIPPQQQAAAPYVDQATSREFAGEAKYLDFNIDQTELLKAYPKLNTREMVNPVGSFKNSDIIAMAHYPTYTTKRSLYNQSIADITNPCMRWINNYVHSLDSGDMYLFNYCPVRLQRIDHNDCVVQRSFAPEGTDIMDKSFIRKWGKSAATIGIIFGHDNSERYKRLITHVANRSNELPICLSRQKMYGEEVHAYLESDEAGLACRITFLIYHPESHIIHLTNAAVRALSAELYRIYMSVLFPARPVRQLRRTVTRRPGLWLAKMPSNLTSALAQGGDERTAVGLVDYVFKKLILPEAKLSLQLAEDDIPAALRSYLAFKLPFELDHTLNDMNLPFGHCALVAYLIARLDREGTALPKHLCDIPPHVLQILRGPLLCPARSILMPVLLFTLSKLSEAVRRRVTAEVSKAWTIIVWDKLKVLFADQPELFMTRETYPTRPMLSSSTLWPHVRVQLFREVSAYRIDETEDLAVVQLVKRLHYNIRRNYFKVRDQEASKGAGKHSTMNLTAYSWAHRGTLGEAFNAMEVIKLMASPEEKVKQNGERKQPSNYKSTTYIRNRSSRSRINAGQHDPVLVARFDEWYRVATEKLGTGQGSGKKGLPEWTRLLSFLVGKLLRGQIAELAELPPIFSRYIPKRFRAVPKEPIVEVEEAEEAAEAAEECV